MSLLYGDNFEGQIDLSGKNYAFYNLFYNCTTIKNAKNLILPAAILSYRCYDHMFSGCTNLTSAPELPAAILAEYCYYCMFSSCNKLNYIKMLATDISALNCLKSWVSGVADSGTFVKNKNATWDIVGVSGIPEGWAVMTE
jgi:hypothetical protein